MCLSRARRKAIIIDVCMHGFNAGKFARIQGKDPIGMPASDPSDETGTTKMAHNATAEKSSAAKYGHAGRHDAKVSRQLRLSHSYSTGTKAGIRPGLRRRRLCPDKERSPLTIALSSLPSYPDLFGCNGSSCA
jgi:hypothetical protein